MLGYRRGPGWGVGGGGGNAVLPGLVVGVDLEVRRTGGDVVDTADAGLERHDLRLKILDIAVLIGQAEGVVVVRLRRGFQHALSVVIVVDAELKGDRARVVAALALLGRARAEWLE